MKKGVCVVIAVLAGTSGSLAQGYQPEDFLPLTVGNSWSYRHSYTNAVPDLIPIPGYENSDPRNPPPDSLLFTSRENVTITITHTEEINGYIYYVFSDIDYAWPPIPFFFLAGKKVRWGDDGRLIEHGHDTEISLYDFSNQIADPSRYEVEYSIPEQNGFNRVKGNFTSKSPRFTWYKFFFSGNAEVQIGGVIEFLHLFGIVSASKSFTRADHTEFLNEIAVDYAIIEGKRLDFPDVIRPTMVKNSAWGAIKNLSKINQISPLMRGK